jgi:hypothetical protein
MLGSDDGLDTRRRFPLFLNHRGRAHDRERQLPATDHSKESAARRQAAQGAEPAIVEGASTQAEALQNVMLHLALFLFLACPSNPHMACPDPRLTPGVADPALTKAVICDPKFRTGKHRAVGPAEKRQACLAYGITHGCPGSQWELDHSIAIYDGGANVIGNIWPEPIAQARRKDVLERRVHKSICSDAITLPEGQRMLAHDWPGSK